MTRSETIRKTSSYSRKRKKILAECEYTCEQCGFSIQNQIDDLKRRNLKAKIGELDFPDNLIFLRKYNTIKSRILNQIQIHHIVPLSEGGSIEKSNVRVLCTECHKKIHQLEFIENNNKKEKFKK